MNFTNSSLKSFFIFSALMTLLFSEPPKVRGQAHGAATAIGTYAAVGGGITIFQDDYGKRLLGGGVLYTDLNPTWRYGLEGEIRYLRVHSAEQVTETNYLAGIRVALRPWGVQPYAKLLVGAGRISLPFDYASGTYFTYAPGGGVDYTLSDRLSVRLFDFEYQLWPDFSYGSLRPYGVSAGLRLRLNNVETIPDSKRKMHHSNKYRPRERKFW